MALMLRKCRNGLPLSFDFENNLEITVSQKKKKKKRQKKVGMPSEMNQRKLLIIPFVS
jgi:hypothetical protein